MLYGMTPVSVCKLSKVHQQSPCCIFFRNSRVYLSTAARVIYVGPCTKQVGAIRDVTRSLHHRAMLRRARYFYDKSSVRPSVTLVDCDHTCWNSSKIISRLVTFAICWLLNLHRRLPVVWYCRGSTTATLCSTAFHAAISRSYSVFRTMQHGSFFRH